MNKPGIGWEQEETEGDGRGHEDDDEDAVALDDDDEQGIDDGDDDGDDDVENIRELDNFEVNDNQTARTPLVALNMSNMRDVDVDVVEILRRGRGPHSTSGSWYSPLQT